MRMTTLTFAILFLLGIAPWACKSKEQEAAASKAAAAEPTGTPAPATVAPATAAPAAPAAVVGSWKDIPNIEGFIADVPASALPNGVGGAAGFHAEDDSFALTWSETSPEEQAKDLAAVKADAEAFLFVSWIKSDAASDGFVLEWESSKIDSEGNPNGTQFSFQIRRSVAGKSYTCSGAVTSREALDSVETSCLTVRAR